jgi:hypothetical protein
LKNTKYPLRRFKVVQRAIQLVVLLDKIMNKLCQFKAGDMVLLALSLDKARSLLAIYNQKG